MAGAVAPEDPHQRPHHDHHGHHGTDSTGGADGATDVTDSDTKQAVTTLKQVIAHYNARLASARRSPGGAHLVGAWLTARDDAVDDLDRLETEDPDGVARIAARYAARLRQLQDDRAG
ncbi:hypothetical protein [Streptomyces sp. NPDC089799]|uniref:hypothetical protein n=1 Tax=Streptomyces sp. NPDC089799 TaxID=3155066 RepID=UPI003420D42C